MNYKQCGMTLDDVNTMILKALNLGLGTGENGRHLTGIRLSEKAGMIDIGVDGDIRCVSCPSCAHEMLDLYDLNLIKEETLNYMGEAAAAEKGRKRKESIAKDNEPLYDKMKQYAIEESENIEDAYHDTAYIVKGLTDKVSDMIAESEEDYTKETAIRFKHWTEALNQAVEAMTKLYVIGNE